MTTTAIAPIHSRVAALRCIETMLSNVEHDIPQEPSGDDLLDALNRVATQLDRLHLIRRLLLALARERTHPKPYPLTTLAAAADMSVSGIRTAYTARDARLIDLLIEETTAHHTPEM